MEENEKETKTVLMTLMAYNASPLPYMDLFNNKWNM